MSGLMGGKYPYTEENPWTFGAGKNPGLNWAGGPDTAAYLQANPDVAKNPQYASNPYQHWVDWGQYEGRGMSSWDQGGGKTPPPMVMDTLKRYPYTEQNPWKFGVGKEAPQQGKFFDAEYLSRNKDVAQNPLYKSNPYQHWLDWGQYEGRSRPVDQPVGTNPRGLMSPYGNMQSTYAPQEEYVPFGQIGRIKRSVYGT